MKYTLFILALLILPTLALAATSTSPGFVPLTNIPFIQEAGNAFNLDQFLNGLYRLCIGAAAVLAVLQIMRAGIMYMGGDSVTEKKEAKNLIALSIGGLILVLSPVVVFSVINPEILTLKIGNIEKLKPTEKPYDASQVGAQTCASWTNTQFVNAPASNLCSSVLQGGGWAKISESCCAGAPAAGQICCGKDKNYTPPAPKPGDSGTYTFRIEYKETDGEACRAVDERTYTSQSQCAAGFTTSTGFLSGKTYAVAKTCTEPEHTPTPQSAWDQIKSLKPCD